jgi:cobalt-zinc-cadmium efflux system protein
MKFYVMSIPISKENTMKEHNFFNTEPLIKKLQVSIILTFLVFLLQAIGGIVTGSLALLADAGHVLMDAFSLLLSYGAMLIALKPSTATKTFGWHRAEILAALVNGLLLLFISGHILHQAIQRILNPRQIDVQPMLWVAIIGMAINGIVAYWLHKGKHRDLNIRSAYFHVLSDMLASLGVVFGGMVILFTDWVFIDSIVGVVITVLILLGAFRVLNETIHILLEGTPRHLDLHRVADELRNVQGVDDVHDLHIWTVCSHIIAFSGHIRLKQANRDVCNKTVTDAQKMLASKFCVSHSTIQVDCEGCTDELITQDLWHKPDKLIDSQH